MTAAVEKFTESISFDKALYKHDIMGSRAHASMLAHQVPNILALFGSVRIWCSIVVDSAVCLLLGFDHRRR